MSVLRTRLFKPRVAKGYLERERLFKRMRANEHKSIHKVVAAAGYGKSVFVSQWLDRVGNPYCWISLEDDCNDLRIFLHYLVESLKILDQASVTELESIGRSSILSQSKELAKSIVNCIHNMHDGLYLVLDDYHLISNQEIHRVVNEVVQHYPEQHKLILISRTDPPLNLRRLSAYQGIHEIRMVDLMFTVEEIMALSMAQLQQSIPLEIAKGILEQTEGWVVPIRLWLKELSVQKELDKNVMVARRKSNTMLHELLEDVFSKQDASVRESLMLASLFPRFNMDLFKGLHEMLHPDQKPAFNGIKILLETLLEQSLFIFVLDEENTWYRFHHLVKEFLSSRIRKMYSKDVLKEVFKYGSSFFANHDARFEALQLSIQIKDYPTAIALFNKGRYERFDNQRFDISRLWLSLFPDEIIAKCPSLLMIRAINADLSKNDPLMEQDLDRTRKLLPPIKDASEKEKALWGEYHATLTSLLYSRNDMDGVLLHGKNGMKLMRNQSAYLHDYAMGFYILALCALGQARRARNILESRLASLKDSEVISRMNTHTLFCILGYMEGDLNHTFEQALVARTLALKTSNKGVLLMVNYYAAVALYLRNDLDKALQFTEEALRSQYVSRPSWIIECLYLKCLCQIAELSDYKQQECIEKIQDLQDQFPSEAFKDLRSFMQTEFFLRNGDIQKAWDSWIVLEGTNTSYKYHYYQPRLTEIRLLMANHPYRDLDRAEALLNDYESLARETHDPNLHMQTLVLKIVLMVLQNDSDKALKQLRSMLAETRKESIIRLFTDLGEPIYTLLGSLTGKEKSDPYIRKILHSFERSPSRVVSKAAGRNKDQDLVKIALSEKETQILELISEGYQNKEIADKLCHSLGTIKTYVYNLYQKIGVKNRAQAIAHYSTTFRKSSQAAPLDS